MTKHKIDRARENHRKLVQQHGRLSGRKDKLVKSLTRTQKQVDAAERAIARSQKRLDKLMAAATHTGGPTCSPVEGLVSAIDAKAPILPDLNDELRV